MLLAVVAGCSTAGPSPDPASSSDGVRSPSVPASGDLGSSPSTSAPPASPSSIPASGNPAASSLADAVDVFLATDSAAFDLVVTRFKPGVPDELTAAASGVVDPAGDRGRMRFELFPNDAEGSPFAFGAFDIAWDPTNYRTKAGQDDLDGAWQHTTRAAAPGMALIGRVNEEPVALLRLAAAAEPDEVEALPPGQLNGQPAERWLVSVPATTPASQFVPPETYLAFSQVFGRPDLPLEVWLVDGEVARVGYVLEREKAPYGGPDRIETWYDWSDIGEPIELTLPPRGRHRGDPAIPACVPRRPTRSRRSSRRTEPRGRRQQGSRPADERRRTGRCRPPASGSSRGCRAGSARRRGSRPEIGHVQDPERRPRRH